MSEVTIIGAGPAGLFAADILSQNGIECVILEMGKEMHNRECPQSPSCDCPQCDILEGIGGAGGFSDGKNTYSLGRGTQTEKLLSEDKEKYLNRIDEIMLEHGDHGVAFGKLEEKPDAFNGTALNFESYKLRHVGSDGIQLFIDNYAENLRARNVMIHSKTKVLSIVRAIGKGYILRVEKEGRVVNHSTEALIIATGLQGSPWLERQATILGIPLSHGPAGFGIRVEAPHEVLAPLFNIFYDFKLSFGPFRSFCCNRRGYVLNENHRTMDVINVNGHSYRYEKESDYSNFAIISKVSDHTDPQSTVKSIAKMINEAGQGSTVVQRLVDFMDCTPTKPEDLHGLTNPQATVGVDVSQIVPPSLWAGFCSFLTELAVVVPGILNDETVIYAPEIKYYGMKFPVSFDTWEVEPDLYVVGNASGHLDSFVSAALTGMIAATNIVRNKGE